MNEHYEDHVCNTVFSRELVCATITKVVHGSVLNRAEIIDFPCI